MHRAFTFSFELAAQVVSVGRPRLARRLKSLLVAGEKKSNVRTTSRIMRHRDETCGWHVCAGRVKHVLRDLDHAVAGSGHHDDGGAGMAN